MDRQELAAFLRSRRARIRPADVGLRTGTRRRTPGLRREEIAHLAGMSVDYYIRLEQGRGPRPSRQILAALARALRLTDDERGHLHHLAGEPPEPPGGPPRDVPPGILHLLDRLDDTPAYVLNPRHDILAWNPLAAALMTDFAAMEPGDRNVIRWLFTGPTIERYDTDAYIAQLARESVADLRAASGRYPNDPGIAALVADVSARSPLFARLWAEGEVGIRRGSRKSMNHPLVGELELHCDVLYVPERDQRVVLYTVAPGTPSHAGLKRLREIAAGRTGGLETSAARPRW
ncbi:helix-turn-helix transcriptional regulator [Actinomadura chibensis]|uniref:Helix-turn-helix transcriptional regulator n=1 Tax=Actinomadura chibensis TaxID=392828 RepID=A0A5D0N372_9ACTN|nr:helix-turn-helix transcriptional regulator [Actinomadura chibensis]TYB38810.1 helix-turn-helix transcriptional regulator [Actinomadura chibensis]